MQTTYTLSREAYVVVCKYFDAVSFRLKHVFMCCPPRCLTCQGKTKPDGRQSTAKFLEVIRREESA